MNPSALFISRPIGTTLLSIGLFLAGVVAYFNLPVASLPNADLPSVRVSAGLPGADPETVAATIAAPLERRIGEIAGVNELTSVSQLGTTSIQVQFDLSRNADDAARDIQAAINAAQADLPSSLSRRPTIRKSNTAGSPIMILAMTSPIRRATDLYDIGDLIVNTRISQVQGVAEVLLGGAQTPAVRVVADPAQLQTRSLGLEDVRTAITQANSLVPVGTLDGPDKSTTIVVNGQINKPADYASLVVKVKNGDVVRIGDVSQVSTGTSNRLSAGYFNSTPAVIFIIFKTADANVIKTVDQIYELLPKLALPADVKLTVLNDRTKTIRASISDIQRTMIASIALVMMVVFVFLRRGIPTLAAGVAVPLSLAGTVALMWFSGYTLDNFSLVALTISVGFVVDDAIVTIENCYRNMEAGLKPLQAALEGARQIGFTIISISISLVAAFIPLLFMGGIIGRLLQEFAWTLTYAILISAVISLTLTPMICGRLIRLATAAARDLARQADRAFLRGIAPGIRAVSCVGSASPRPDGGDNAHIGRSYRSAVQDAAGRPRAPRRHRPRDGDSQGGPGYFLRRTGGDSEKDQRDYRSGPRCRWRRGFHRRLQRFRRRQPGPILHVAEAAARAKDASS